MAGWGPMAYSMHLMPLYRAPFHRPPGSFWPPLPPLGGAQPLAGARRGEQAVCRQLAALCGAEDADLELVVGPEQQRLRAHALVLKARSAYFRGMLSSGMRESHSGTIELPQCSAQAFELLLPFIYSGHLRLDSPSLDKINGCYELAAYLQLEEFPAYMEEPPNSALLRRCLRSECESLAPPAQEDWLRNWLQLPHLRRHVERVLASRLCWSENVLRMLCTACAFGLPALRDQCLASIKEHVVGKLLQSPEGLEERAALRAHGDRAISALNEEFSDAAVDRAARGDLASSCLRAVGEGLSVVVEEALERLVVASPPSEGRRHFNEDVAMLLRAVHSRHTELAVRLSRAPLPPASTGAAASASVEALGGAGLGHGEGSEGASSADARHRGRLVGPRKRARSSS